MVEYRGYGLSNGVPTERGLVTDARAAIDYLHTRHDLDHSQLILFGRSLGGAVVVDVAADTVYGQKLMCAIVENTFSSIPEMAVELVHPSVKYIPNLLFKNKVRRRRFFIMLNFIGVHPLAVPLPEQDRQVFGPLFVYIGPCGQFGATAHDEGLIYQMRQRAEAPA